MKLRDMYFWLASLAALMLLSACNIGGDDDDDTKYGHVRLINAINTSTAPSVQLSANTSSDDDPDYTISSVAAGSASSYSQFETHTYSVVVAATDGSLSASATTSLTVSDDGEDDEDYRYSVVAYQRGGVIKLVSIQEDNDAPNSGFAKLTAINAGSDAGSLDVYVVPEGTTSLSGRSPIFAALSTSSTSTTQSTSTGTYDIVITAKDKPSDTRLTLASVALADKAIYTVVLTPTPGGALLDGIIVQHNSGVSLNPNTYARLRVAAAYGTNTAVQASASNGNTSVTSPNVGAYKLIPAEDAVTVTVGGTTAATLPANTFARGYDYTVLAYNTTSDPEITYFEDNNQLPSSGAKIRLINASVSGGGISLKVNNTLLFSEVAYGIDSDYSGISSGSTTLRLESAVSGFEVDSEDYNTPQTISSGSVYSLFALGSTTDTIMKLMSDR